MCSGDMTNSRLSFLLKHELSKKLRLVTSIRTMIYESEMQDNHIIYGHVCYHDCCCCMLCMSPKLCTHMCLGLGIGRFRT